MRHTKKKTSGFPRVVCAVIANHRPILSAAVLALTLCTALQAEDGYELWLRYHPLSDPGRYSATVTQIVSPSTSPTGTAIRTELKRALDSLLNRSVPLVDAVGQSGAIVAGTPATCPTVGNLGWGASLDQRGDDGYRIESTTNGGRAVTVIASRTEIGVLYGTFHFIRLVQTLQSIDALRIQSRPRVQRRLLNHWDNLSGSIEQGFAGGSLWDWSMLPGTIKPRYIDYARANASIGINGAVLNNVNANAQILTAGYISRVAALSGAFRPYGIRVYLTARFSAPQEIGGLSTSDPMNAGVRAWWKSKADEIYTAIPDFGGFLVKANSEGQPGPQSYGRTHAQGANCLAEALAPHNGIVMWRAFVYDQNAPDRARTAYDEFKPLDGQFGANVIVQAKNGPIDFQPREPVHPLFGGMPNTAIAAELEITAEYLGYSTHGVYAGPMWEEVLNFDTHAAGIGSTVGGIIDGSVYNYPITVIAGVANTGTDINWCGHHFLQANWYAFGRFAWDHTLSARQILEEWAPMTWSTNRTVTDTIVAMLMGSHEVCVNFQEPLGLVHQMNASYHYDPAPGQWSSRPDWSPPYYNRADTLGLGFNRTATGTDFVNQYFAPVRDMFANISTCPEKYLLFFHHVCWAWPMKSGRTLWDELNAKYNEGVQYTTDMRSRWSSLQSAIDSRRFSEVSSKLQGQESHAKSWRSTMLSYFQTFYDKRVACGATLTRSDQFPDQAANPPGITSTNRWYIIDIKSSGRHAVSVCNASGAMVWSGRGSDCASYRLDRRNMAPGIYVTLIEFGNQRLMQRFLIP